MWSATLSAPAPPKAGAAPRLKGNRWADPRHLTPAQQKEAARRRAEGEGARFDELARSYNVGISTIRRDTCRMSIREARGCDQRMSLLDEGGPFRVVGFRDNNVHVATDGVIGQTGIEKSARPLACSYRSLATGALPLRFTSFPCDGRAG